MCSRAHLKAAVGLCLLMAAGYAQAALIPDLNLEHYPRVLSTNVQVTYDPTGGPGDYGLLTISGTAWDLYLDEGPDAEWVEGPFTIEAHIDRASDDAVWASLTVLDQYYGWGTMFSSTNLVDFGFGGDDIIQFEFVQEGVGGLADQGDLVGVIVAGMSIPNDLFAEAVPPTWDEPFSNNGNGQANALYFPEPTTAALLGTFGLVLLRRRSM